MECPLVAACPIQGGVGTDYVATGPLPLQCRGAACGGRKAGGTPPRRRVCLRRACAQANRKSRAARNDPTLDKGDVFIWVDKPLLAVT